MAPSVCTTVSWALAGENARNAHNPIGAAMMRIKFSSLYESHCRGRLTPGEIILVYAVRLTLVEFRLHTRPLYRKVRTCVRCLEFLKNGHLGSSVRRRDLNCRANAFRQCGGRRVCVAAGTALGVDIVALQARFTRAVNRQLILARRIPIVERKFGFWNGEIGWS